jgi:hypothetical protein
MYKWLFFLLILVDFHSVYSQSFDISSQFCIGATNSDIPVKQAKLNNGNKIILTQSNSPASADKTENSRGDYDIWIVCLDANEQIVWQKTIGGTNIDLPSDLLISADQNIYIGGTTKSPASFEQSNVLFGSWDAWMIKLNSSGDIVWDKNYGGIAIDGFNELIELTSGNIMAFGSSSSSNSGNKTSMNYGSTDIWCLKLNSNGSILNDWSIGGSDIDTRPMIVQAGPNLFKLVAESWSNLSGLKTQESFGFSDLWVIDLDTNCVIQQQKTIGGSDIDQVSDVILSSDGNLLVLAQSWSNQSGLKSEDSYGLMDTWLLKLNNNLDILQQKTIGGMNQDFGNRISEWSNGNIVVAANSDSPFNSFKSEANIGMMDVWLYAVDANFNLIADQTLGTPSDDYVVDFGIEPSTSNINVLAYSNGSAQNDKICAGIGGFDIWGINFNSTLSLNELTTKLDFNVFPNPASNNLNISVNTDQPLIIELGDFSGKIINEFTLSSQIESFDISNLSNGIYWLNFYFNGQPQTKKLVVLNN